MAARYAYISMDRGMSRHLPASVPVPDQIWVVPVDMDGKHFLHLHRVVGFDLGHDWNSRGGQVHLGQACYEQHLVFVYGTPTCEPCGATLSVGCRFCPQCGVQTSSIVDALEL